MVWVAVVLVEAAAFACLIAPARVQAVFVAALENSPVVDNVIGRRFRGRWIAWMLRLSGGAFLAGSVVAVLKLLARWPE